MEGQGTTLHLNILDTFPVLIVDVDRYGNILFANKRARELLALPDDLEDITIEQILDAESHKTAGPLIEQLFSGEGDVTTTWGLNMPGPEVVVTVNAVAIVENDYPIRVRLFLHPVTEPVAADPGRFPASAATGDHQPAVAPTSIDPGEHHRTREYLETLLQKSGLLVYAFDRRSVLVETNRRFVEITGYGLTDTSTLQDLLQKLYPDAELQERVHRMHSDMFRAKHAKDVVLRVRTRAGASRHIAWSSGTLRDPDGKQMGFLVIGKDVTEQVRLEARLSTTRDLLDRVSDAVVIIDGSGRIAQWLGGAQRLLGYEPTQVRGKRFVDLFPAPKRQAIQRSLVAGIRRDQRWSGSILMQTGEGKAIAARIDVSVLPGPDHTVVGLVALFRDQTREKQLEAALEKCKQALAGTPRTGP